MEVRAAKACKHIVLVHRACVGGWTWFKVAARLRSAGHRVTTPDLAASGVDPRPLREVPTFRDYTKPLLDLLDSLPPGEKVVLVGHSLGGVNVALAAELFPEKVAAAVFLCAFMPDHTSRPSHVLEMFVEGKWLDWMDTEMKPQDAEGKLPTSMMFGPEVTRAKFYQMCSPEMKQCPLASRASHVDGLPEQALHANTLYSPNSIRGRPGSSAVPPSRTTEDLTLGRSLMRVSSMFVEDLLVQQPFSKGRYGSVRKVYIVCKQDYAIVEKFQRWMIENYPVEEVKEIDGADHMAMLSTPNELARCLADITENYA